MTEANHSLPSGEPLRESLIDNAVKFLLDPKVTSSPLSKKITFLESKGLTSQEIDESVKRISLSSTTAANVLATPPFLPSTSQPSNSSPFNSLSGSPGVGSSPPSYHPSSSLPYYPPGTYQYSQGGQMVPLGVHSNSQIQGYGWRDYFVAATLAGGVGYGVWVMGKVKKDNPLFPCQV